MWKCAKCHGKNIEVKAWIDANNDTVLDSVEPLEVNDRWCRDCEEHVEFTLDTQNK